MTSCMSEPTMASSMVSQRMIRGTYGGDVSSLEEGWLLDILLFLPLHALPVLSGWKSVHFHICQLCL